MTTANRLHVIVRGRVQGVGFRWFVADLARRLDLDGWVKNRADGAVELCASGPALNLSALEREVARGPNGAHVERLERVDSSNAEILPTPFSIVRER